MNETKNVPALMHSSGNRQAINDKQIKIQLILIICGSYVL